MGRAAAAPSAEVAAASLAAPNSTLVVEERVASASAGSRKASTSHDGAQGKETKMTTVRVSTKASLTTPTKMETGRATVIMPEVASGTVRAQPPMNDSIFRARLAGKKSALQHMRSGWKRLEAGVCGSWPRSCSFPRTSWAYWLPEV